MTYPDITCDEIIKALKQLESGEPCDKIYDQSVERRLFEHAGKWLAWNDPSGRISPHRLSAIFGVFLALGYTISQNRRS